MADTLVKQTRTEDKALSFRYADFFEDLANKQLDIVEFLAERRRRRAH